MTEEKRTGSRKWRSLSTGGDTPLRDVVLALADEIGKGNQALEILMDGPAGKMTLELRLVGKEGEMLSAVSETAAPMPLPTAEEVAAYRDTFRVELDKNMNNSSGSPSTEAHAIALRNFVKARNGSLS